MKKITLLTVIAILVPLIVFGFLGCMKKPDHTPDYGPEVPFADIEKTIQSNIPPDPTSIKLGQYVSIDVTQVVDTQPPTTLSQKLDTVTVYDDKTNPNEIHWTFMVEMNELSNTGTWQNSKQPYTLVYEKSNQQSTTPSQPPTAATPSKMSAYSLKALSTEDASSPTKVTYHNLQREEGYMAVPLLVQNKADCGGVKDCTKGIRYLRLSFDRVVWDSDDHGTKTTYRITYSPDIPSYVADWSHPDGIYLTNQLQFCMQTWVEVTSGNQKQIVPVQQCADMRDFQFGHD